MFSLSIRALRHLSFDSALWELLAPYTEKGGVSRFFVLHLGFDGVIFLPLCRPYNFLHQVIERNCPDSSFHGEAVFAGIDDKFFGWFHILTGGIKTL